MIDLARDAPSSSMQTTATANLLQFLSPLRLAGPILDKELRVTSRRRRLYVLRFAYVVALVLVVLQLWYSLLRSRGGGSGALQVSRLGEMGKGIVAMVVWFQFITGQILAAALLGDAISSEVRQRTLDVLMVTPVRSFQIVIGKLVSKLLQAASLLAISLPILAVVRVFGGVPWDYAVAGLCVTASTGIFAGALSLTLSISNRHPYHAVLAVILWDMVVWGLLAALLMGLSQSGYLSQQRRTLHTAFDQSVCCVERADAGDDEWLRRRGRVVLALAVSDPAGVGGDPLGVVFLAGAQDHAANKALAGAGDVGGNRVRRRKAVAAGNDPAGGRFSGCVEGTVHAAVQDVPTRPALRRSAARHSWRRHYAVHRQQRVPRRVLLFLRGARATAVSRGCGSCGGRRGQQGERSPHVADPAGDASGGTRDHLGQGTRGLSSESTPIGAAACAVSVHVHLGSCGWEESVADDARGMRAAWEPCDLDRVSAGGGFVLQRSTQDDDGRRGDDVGRVRGLEIRSVRVCQSGDRPDGRAPACHRRPRGTA